MEGEEHFGIGTICKIFKQSGYSPHFILLLNNFASIGAIVLLASFRNLVDMPSIPQDEVFLRLVIQAMTSSAQMSLSSLRANGLLWPESLPKLLNCFLYSYCNQIC